MSQDELMSVNSDDSDDSVDFEPTNIFSFIYKFFHDFSEYCLEHHILF